MTDMERRYCELLEKVLENSGKPMMLPKPVPCYDRNDSKYPDHIRMSFDDGQTAIYDLRIEQPAPVIVENIKIIRKWKQGYVNKPMRRRNRT